VTGRAEEVTMRLKPYADAPARRSVQIVADLLVILWVAVWVRVAVLVHDTVITLAGLGYTVQDRAGAVASGLSAAGDGAGRVPLVGDQLSRPLVRAGEAASSVAGTGQQAGDTITWLSWPMAVAVIAAPVLFVGGIWLLLRLRYAYRAGAVADLAAAPGGQRLLALRALSTGSVNRLLRVDPDPLGGWQRDDPEVVAGLARLAVNRFGVRPGVAPS